MDGRRYSIGELAEFTGVSRRTVHFYVQRQLIDAPLGLGRGRHYDERHVRQINEVRTLQGLGVPLAQMRPATRRTDEAPSAGDVAALPQAAGVPGLPSVTPSIMSVVRVRVAENVTLELSTAGGAGAGVAAVPVTPALVADLTAAVASVLEAHGRPGRPGRGQSERQEEVGEES